MPAVLGVDGGGTKTHAIVADDSGDVLGCGVQAASNWEEVGFARAADALQRAATIALEEARVSPQELAASVFGLAGVDWESDQLRAANLLNPLQLSGPREIVNDAFVALRAGSTRDWGVVVIAGTGCVSVGRNEDGQTFRTLGLGAYFGDFGGGSDISEEAVKAVAEAYIGSGPSTALSELLCEHERVGTVAELLELISREQDDLPYVAQGVLEVAEAGDEVAGAIVEKAGRALGRSGAFVAERLGLADKGFELVLAGGLFQARTDVLRQRVVATVRETARLASPILLSSPPVIGAVLKALELAGHCADEAVAERLRAGLTEPLRLPPMERI